MRVPTALRLHDGNDRDELFLCLLRIKFWTLILFRDGLDKYVFLSYNTTPAEEGMDSSLFLATWFFWPHIYHLFGWDWPHVAVGMFFSALSIFALRSLVFLLCRRSNFRALLPPKNDDHMTIILYLDLTTSLTINRTGVHGDKMSREYEKAVFA